MTVDELIARLLSMPRDAIVKADAGDGAWADVEEVTDQGECAEGRIVCVGPEHG